MPRITPQYVLIEDLDVELLLSAKRKSLAIEVGPEFIKVRAPKRMPTSLIFDFVRQKKDWITQQQANFPVTPSQLSLSLGSTVLFENQAITIKLVNGQGKVVKEAATFIVPISERNESDEPHSKIARKLKAWYINQGQSTIEQDVEHYAELMFDVREMDSMNRLVKVREYKKRWGCCSQSKPLNNKPSFELKFNWRLMMAPASVRRYVVIHELAHIKQMNHSKAFWKLVEQQLPNWRDHKSWLDQYGAHLYRW